MNFSFHQDALGATPALEPTRTGFGRGLVTAGEQNPNVLALCADLTDSTCMRPFAERFGTRFIEVGIAEQNLVTVAAGLAHAGFIPFTASYAAFSPGRSWEQIKTTAALNRQPVKIVGAHAGLYTGQDGATHQMLEDLALMRVIPTMVVVAPGDSVEAEKATLALAENGLPSYIRLAREATPIFSTPASPFELGKATHLVTGDDVTVISTGTMTPEALRATVLLAERGIGVDLLHMATVKPLDEEAILASVSKTGCVVTVEEGQVIGGLGGAVAELLGDQLPTLIKRLGVVDRFGETGLPGELLEEFGLNAAHIAEQVGVFVASGMVSTWHRNLNPGRQS